MYIYAGIYVHLYWSVSWHMCSFWHICSLKQIDQQTYMLISNVPMSQAILLISSHLTLTYEEGQFDWMCFNEQTHERWICWNRFTNDLINTLMYAGMLFIFFFQPHITLREISTYIGCRSLQPFNLNGLSTEYFIALQLLTTVKYDWLSDRTGRLCGNHCIWLSNNLQVTHCEDSFINHGSRFSSSRLLILSNDDYCFGFHTPLYVDVVLPS